MARRQNFHRVPYMRLLADITEDSRLPCLVYERSDVPGDEELGEILRDALHEGKCKDVARIRKDMAITYELQVVVPFSDRLYHIFCIPIEPNAIDDLDWVNFRELADYVGTPWQELYRQGKSKDAIQRAYLYQQAGQAFGWTNLDHEPIGLKRTAEDRAASEYEDDTMSEPSIQERYQKDLEELEEFGNCADTPGYWQ